jgi:hypothetical protein
MPEKPDFSNRKSREKMYNAYLCKNKPFWYYFHKGFYILGILSGTAFLIILINNTYPEYLGLSILILIASLSAMAYCRYRMDGSLLKPWWEVY